MSIIKALSEKMTNHDNTDPDWVQYVYDHLDYIKQTSGYTLIPKEIMFQYRFRPELYLESINTNRSLTWIFLLINKIHTKENFKDINHVYVINPKAIQQMYSQYEVYLQTIQSVNIRNLSE